MKRAIPVGVSLSLYLRQVPRVLCHLRVITNRKSARYTLYCSLSTLLLIFTFTGFALAQAPNITKIEQGANGRFSTPNNPIDWVTGNINEQKAHYAECMVIPYHMEIIDLGENTTYCLDIGYDTRKNGQNAIDYLTSWHADPDNRHNIIFGHAHNGVNERIDPLDDTALDLLAPDSSTMTIPTPTFPGATMTEKTNALAAFNALASPPELKENQFVIYNGEFVDAPCYVMEESLSNGTTSTMVRLCFKLKKKNTSMPNTVVLAWGGHIASSMVWGAGTSATSISGSPYHMFVDACNMTTSAGACPNVTASPLGGVTPNVVGLGGCGNKEVQLQASAVVGGACTIIGSDPICLPNPGGSQYTAILDPNPTPGKHYIWTISNNSAGASFSGSSTGTDLKTVTVLASQLGTFTLKVDVYPDAQNTKNNDLLYSCSRSGIVVSNTITPVITSVPNVTTVCSSSATPIVFRSDAATATNDAGEVGVWEITKVGGGTVPSGALIDNGYVPAGPYNQATFYPNIAGGGTFTITYKFTTAAGCEGVASRNITVNSVNLISGVTVSCPTYPVTTTITATFSASSPTFTWERATSLSGPWVPITTANQDQGMFNVTYIGSLISASLDVRLLGLSPVTQVYFRVNMTSGGVTCTSGSYLLSFQFCTLPIELYDFKGKQVDNIVALRWTTVTEKDNAYIEVQRSKDGIQFYPIGQEKGHGTTATPQSYLFVDQQPMPGINYYRLKQVDLDGKYEYHKVIAVPFESKKAQEIKIYPSPVKNMLTIEWSEKVNGEHILSITDMLGRTVLRRALVTDTTQENLDVQALAPGYYFITIQTGNKVSAIKFVKE